MRNLPYLVAGMQPLRQAASEGNFQEVKRLTKVRGANVNEAGPESLKTSLHWGASCENNEIVSYLLKKNASVDPLDADGNTPFNLLVQAPTRSLQKKLAVIDTLLAHAADPLRANNRGKTPLMNLIQLRDSIPESHFHQLKSIKVLIARIKEQSYKKAQQKGQTLRIYPNGQVVWDTADYLRTAHYLPESFPAQNASLR